MQRISLISDTHGLLGPEALDALAGSDLIIHAGDVGKLENLDHLRELAPVVAVRGNIDIGDWALPLPETAVVQADAISFFVVHDLNKLKIDPAAEGYSLVVSGHSHKAARVERVGVLYLNPRAAGPRPFKLPITVVRVDLGVPPWQVEFVDLANSGNVA